MIPKIPKNHFPWALHLTGKKSKNICLGVYMHENECVDKYPGIAIKCLIDRILVCKIPEKYIHVS